VSDERLPDAASLNNRPTRRPARALRGAATTVADFVRTALVGTFVLVFVVQPVRVEGTSMLPRLHDGERVFVNKFLYALDGWPTTAFSLGRGIERGDIVVFYYPDDPSQRFIKRVIGLPGDVVQIDRRGRVIVNGVALDEPYLDPDLTRLPRSMPPTKVKDHYYFVMGDNRDNSSDSRAWGLLPERYVCGEAFFRFWPLDAIGVLGGEGER
jgi:signal peptidase I